MPAGELAGVEVRRMQGHTPERVANKRSVDEAVDQAGRKCPETGRWPEFPPHRRSLIGSPSGVGGLVGATQLRVLVASVPIHK
jgi:hypothetical protein